MKDAGIRSKKELIKRMIEGEVFYYKGAKIFFSEDHALGPFLSDSCSLDGYEWDHYDDFEQESEWWEELPDQGRLCWVWDTPKGTMPVKKIPALVTYYAGTTYMTTEGRAFKNATPITEGDAELCITK